MPVTRLIVFSLAILLMAACAAPRRQQSNNKPRPAVSQRTATRPLPVVRPSFYVVQSGEGLTDIARRYGLSERELTEWNKLMPPFRVHAGQTLFLFKPGINTTDAKRRMPSTEIQPKLPDTLTKKPENSIDSKTILKLYWQWPLKGAILKAYSGEDSKGIDIAGDFGSPVVAAAAGTVVYSGEGLQGYDNLLIIRHDERFLTAYANNSARLVEEGVTVRQGQPIAKVGSMAGRSYLHFEIRKNGSPVNPADYLSNQAN